MIIKNKLILIRNNFYKINELNTEMKILNINKIKRLICFLSYKIFIQSTLDIYKT